MFDYSHHMKSLVADISARCVDFRHIDADRILVGISRARNRRKDGLQAKLMPLKFQGGLRTARADKRTFVEIPKMIHRGHEILYVVYFCLPRFQNLSFRAKMITVFHELYHISPAFNGDIRRFPGRFYQHSHSEKEYDRTVERFSKQYLSDPATKSFTGFLKLDYNELSRIHGEIGGLSVYVPEPALLRPKQALLFEPD